MKVEKWYDRKTRSWVVQVKDSNGCQVGNAVYVGTKHGAIYEEKLFLKDIKEGKILQ